MKKLKYKVYNLIRDNDKNTLSGNIFDGIIILLIFISIIQVVADTFTLSESIASVSKTIEILTVIVFTIEYIARLWTATYIYPDKRPLFARIQYAITFIAIIDLLAILPFYIPLIIPVDLRVLRSLRMVRLLRLLKMRRYTDALSTISNVLRKKASQLISSFIVVSILMLISAVLMFNAENAAQPDKFDNAFSALWWASATFTTVGYGDIYPVTAIGKILSAVIAMLGIGLVAVPTGIISAGFMEEISDKKEDVCNSTYCPHCGKKLK